MQKNNTPEKWLKKRHIIVRNIVCALLRPYCRLFYGTTADPFKEQGDRPYLILMNHQTPFDQFFVGMSFKGAVYYLATEDIFSKGWISSLIRWLVDPIPIKKQTLDITAIKTCLRVAREGGTIGICPEGNRTYSGKTEYINPSIASLARKLGLPIALYRIEGGYGVEPRWSDVVRRGRIHAYVSRVIEPEEYAGMNNDELFAVINEGLAVDDSRLGGLYRSAKRAEYLERAVYVCPFCGFAEFESSGAVVECKICRRKIEYGEDKRLRGVGFDFPFAYMTQWYEYQKQFVCRTDVTQHTDTPLFCDTSDVYDVIIKKRKEILRQNASIRLYGDRIAIDEQSDAPLILPFAEITAASVLGRNKLNIYHNNRVYQFKGGKRFNALKYVNIYFRHKNIARGDEHGEFLGL